MRRVDVRNGLPFWNRVSPICLVSASVCDAAQTVGKFPPKFNPLFYWRK